MIKKENVLMFGQEGNRQYIFDVNFTKGILGEETYITVYKEGINIMTLDSHKLRFHRETDNKNMYYIATI